MISPSPRALALLLPALAVAGCAGGPVGNTGIVTRAQAEKLGITNSGAATVGTVDGSYGAAPSATVRTTTVTTSAASGGAIAPIAAPRGGGGLSRPAANTAAELNTTSAEERAAAAAPPAEPAGEKKLGTTIASLGDPTEPGFWLKTPLVKAKASGRVVNPANGKSAKVDLIPLSGPSSAGSQLSLPAVQLLGISLTDLPEVEVYRD